MPKTSRTMRYQSLTPEPLNTHKHDHHWVVASSTSSGPVETTTHRPRLLYNPIPNACATIRSRSSEHAALAVLPPFPSVYKGPQGPDLPSCLFHDLLGLLAWANGELASPADSSPRPPSEAQQTCRPPSAPGARPTLRAPSPSRASNCAMATHGYMASACNRRPIKPKHIFANNSAKQSS